MMGARKRNRLFGDCAKRYWSFVVDNAVAFCCCLIVVVVATFITHGIQTSYLRHNGFDPTFADSVIWLLGAGNATLFPLLWCICPAVAMVWLIYLDRGRKGANWALRHGGFRELWIECLVDALTTACMIGVVAFVAAVAVSAAQSHVIIDFENPHGMFAALTEGRTMDSPSLASLLAVSFALCLCVPAATVAVFALLRWVLSNELFPFFIVVVSGLSIVHGSLSFVVDLASAFGLPLDFANPLALLYETSSVAYHTWLPGASHGLWLQVAIVVGAFGVGLLFSDKKEILDN